MAKGLNRFKILTWKNYILARRRLLSLVCEIVALPLLCCLFVVYRILLPVDEEPEMIYKSFGVSDSLSSFCSRSKGLPVAYSPNSPFVTKIVKGMCRRILVEGFSDANELDKAINKNFYYFAAIQFDDVLSTSVFDSSIDEWNTPELYPKDERSPRDSSDQFGGSPHYRERHFLFLQKALIFGLIDSRSDIIGNFKVELKRYPHPQCYGDDFYGSVFVLFMFLIILSGLLYCFVCLIKEVTLEKQKQRKVLIRPLTFL
ncbi:hypothetical protein BDFB_005217 [Asbolus verrucosus]|uniref:Uncharacterized protein n=1 Tax=Asbolus verrucosus TaxID=1661398 RepID=A0A482W755_ASBVE|nr:hypothetical protein BDFB_005217 [Asbolus verrucosus]